MIGKEAIFQEGNVIQVKKFAAEHEACVETMAKIMHQYYGRMSKSTLVEYIGAAYDRGVLDALGRCIHELRASGEYQAVAVIQKLVGDK